ncbi:MAG TPA: hypothetical protein VES03_05585 [Motilibacterales bacterium]|nr:hypothetical protein [Motilibacterales bacterium]
MNPGSRGQTILLQAILGDAQLRVRPEFTAEAGLLIAAEPTVDVALVDLRPPCLSGLDVIPSHRGDRPDADPGDRTR